MTLVLKSEEPQLGDYIWICNNESKCKNIESTWLTSNIRFWKQQINHNSLHEINPEDLPYDYVRHYSINKHFQYNYKIVEADLLNLECDLGFSNIDEMNFWFCSQRSVITHSCHNYLPVGSPYYFTFKDLYNSLNEKNKFILNKIHEENEGLIHLAIKPWLMKFQQDKDFKENRSRTNQYKIENEHKEALERKSKKATFAIYGAIRRKDLKAIEALLLKGAVIDEPNDEGTTALEYAKALNNEKVLSLLVRKVQNSQ